jgi:hypothetical protein
MKPFVLAALLGTDRQGDSKMKRRDFLLGLGALPLAASSMANTAGPQVIVYKTPTCGCCSGWVEHLKAAGFSVTAKDVPDTALERLRLGMPGKFAACHTASVERYVVEGHVPAAEVRRLLAIKPAVVGLVVLGMPLGSPGMEANGRLDPYEVLLVDRRGQASVFASYPKQQATSTRSYERRKP